MGRTWEPRGVAQCALLVVYNRLAFPTTLVVLWQANLAQMHTVLRLDPCGQSPNLKWVLIKT